MARIEITNLKKVKAAYRKKVIKGLRDKKVRTELGEIVIESIRKKVWRKVGFDEPYYKFRERITNPKHPNYTPYELNMTITGELLKDLISNVKFKSAKGKVSYIFKHSNKRHKPYKVITGITKRGKLLTKKTGEDITTKSGRKRRVGSRFEEIRKGLYDSGYEYLADIDDKVLSDALDRVRKTLIKIMSR